MKTNGTLLKLFQEWQEEGIKENDERVNSNMRYLIYYKNFYRCHNKVFKRPAENKKKMTQSFTFIVLCCPADNVSYNQNL
jgi:hypothetical protein